MPIVVQVQSGSRAGQVVDCPPWVNWRIPIASDLALCGHCLVTYLPLTLGWRCPTCGAVIVDLDAEAWRITAGLHQPAFTVGPYDSEESP
jgi:hypothetical protein